MIERKVTLRQAQDIVASQDTRERLRGFGPVYLPVFDAPIDLWTGAKMFARKGYSKTGIARTEYYLSGYSADGRDVLDVLRWIEPHKPFQAR